MASKGLSVAVIVFLLLTMAVFGYFAGSPSRTGSTTSSSSSSSTATTTLTTSTTSTTKSATPVPTWAYAAVVVLLIAGLTVGYIIKRPSVSKR